MYGVRLSRGRMLSSVAVALLTLTAWRPLAAQSDNAPTWQWSADRVEQTVNQVRAGRSLKPTSWPNGARVAVLLSFDVDNELLSLRSESIGSLSEGEYGSRVGLGRVLDALDRGSIPASFFIPAVSLQLAPEMADQIAASGRHEFGIHGWIHENNASLTAEQERRLLGQAIAYIEDLTGTRPTGYRAPSWNFSPNTAGLLEEFGFVYDSSLMADDDPYELVVSGRLTGIVELPVTWVLDDYPLLNVQGNRYSAPSDVLEVWKDEFDRAYAEGSMFLLTTHPHLIGRRSRIGILEELIEYIQSKGPDVWFATHQDAAEYVRGQAEMGP